MAQRLPIKSGKQVLKTFYKVKERFGLSFKREGKGSHVVLSNKYHKNFSVPLHKELGTGLLLSIISDAGMTKDEFLKNDP